MSCFIPNLPGKTSVVTGLLLAGSFLGCYASASASDHKQILFFRAEANYSDISNPANTDGYKNADEGLVFRTPFFRLRFQGPVADKYKYLFQFRYNSSYDTNGRADRTPLAVDYAKLTRQYTDFFSLAIGKHFTGIGGWEGWFNGSDMYLYSRGPSGRNPIWAVGLEADLTYADQLLRLFLLNNDEASAAQKTPFFGFQFMGNINNIWRPRLSYHVWTRDKREVKDSNTTEGLQDTKSAMWSYFGVGLRVTYEGLEANLDFLQDTFESELDIDDGPDADVLTRNILQVAYRMGAWRPKLYFHTRVDETQVSDGSGGYEAQKEEDLGWGVALEHYDQDIPKLKYFVAYTSVATKLDGFDADLERNSFSIGLTHRIQLQD